MVIQYYTRATRMIKPGSLIEYETEISQYFGQKTARSLAIVLRIDWRSRHSNTKIYIIDAEGTKCMIGICSVCRVVSM